MDEDTAVDVFTVIVVLILGSVTVLGFLLDSMIILIAVLILAVLFSVVGRRIFECLLRPVKPA